MNHTPTGPWPSGRFDAAKEKRRHFFVNRRSGLDRRSVYRLGYFARGGAERRGVAERRRRTDRRRHRELPAKGAVATIPTVFKQSAGDT